MSELQNNQNQPLEGQPAEAAEASAAPSTEENSTVFVKRTYTDKKPPRRSGTRRRVTTLVAGVLALAVLVGGIFALPRIFPKEQGQGDTSSVANLVGISMVQVDTANIQKIELQNEYGSFSVFAKEVATSSTATASASTETVWQVEGIDPSLTISGSIVSFVESCAKIEAVRKMNSTSGDFGFDKPAAVVRVTCADSSQSYTLTVGKPSADSTGYYAKLGEDAVYIIEGSYVTPLLAQATEFANGKLYTGLTSAQEPNYFSDGVLTRFDFITFSGKNFAAPIRIEPNPQAVVGLTYLVTQPNLRGAIDEPVEALLALLSEDLTASGMFSYTISNDLKAQYGLNDPSVVMQAKIGDFELKLLVGNLVGEHYAMQVEGVNAIYKVSADAVPFVTATERTYFNPRFYFEGIDTVKDMTFTGNGKTYTFSPTFGEDKDDLTVLHNGQKVSPNAFKVFYRNVLALNIQDFLVEPTAGNPVLTLQIAFNNGKADSTIAFTEFGTRTCLVTVDGVVFGSIPKTQVTKILEYAQNLVDGKEIPEPALG